MPQETLSFSNSRVGAKGKMCLLFFIAVLSTTHLMLQLAGGELDLTSPEQGMQLHGNFSIAGFFAIHFGDNPDGRLPALTPCKE